MVSIKNSKEIEKMREACRVAALAQKAVEEAIKPGISTWELDKIAENEMRKNGASEDSIKECFTSKDGKRNKYVFDNVTAGHEVMIFWNYEEDWFWVYNDGSINGYCEFFRENITKLITPKEKNEQ